MVDKHMNIASWQRRPGAWRLWSAVLFTLLVVACQPGAKKTDTDATGNALWENYRALYCAQLALAQETDALWDEVSAKLDAQLPADMPPDERRNMIAIRNMSLIQMFEVYPSLDTSIKVLVEKAGQEDEALVVKLRQTQQDMEAAEAEIAQFLMDLETKKAASLQEWKTRFEDVRKTPCPGK